MAVGFVFIATPTAFAHVLVTDSASKSSAIVHITPDDDPEAGKPAEFYYELKTKISSTTFSEYRVHVTDEAGNSTTVPITSDATSISISYVFPTQGLYKLELKSIHPWKTSFDLSYSIRVSRGIVGSASSAQNYTWAQPVLIAIGVLTLLLAITFVNNRELIAEHSRFK